MKIYKHIILTSFLFFVFSISLNAQSISGIINDSEGLPLPGATIQNLNTLDGVSTDFDGKFNIDASLDDVLEISFIGFETFQLKISNLSDDFTIQLELGNELEEVVVTALGISRDKKSIGYSQQTVSGEVLATAKETDLNIALTGKVAGVQMIGGSSSTFDNGYLRLRGEDNVLYVVDGIKVYSMTDINTDNVESISVLKGAAATALYGADAQSGVIVITSKKAKAGESFFTIDHSTTMTNVSILPNYQNE